MKNSRKKIISMLLIISFLLAAFIPAVVNAGEVNRVSNGVLSFTAAGTDTVELSSGSDVTNYINAAKEEFYNALTEAEVPVDSTNRNIDPETLFSTTEPYTYAALEGVEISYAMVEGVLTKQFEIGYTAYTVTVASESSSDSNIIRKTTTIYHTRVKGTMTLDGEVLTNYDSGETYIDGNTSDDAVASVINDYKTDMNGLAQNSNATITFEEGISDYYYEAHDEITGGESGMGDVILVGDVNELDIGYTPQQSQVTINTVLEKYQTYKITGTATTTVGDSSSPKQITSAAITLKAPKVGDAVEKVTKTSDGYEYTAQSIQPTVTTTTEGVEVTGYWVCGLEEASDESFFGTFEEDVVYYALIDFEAQEGYEFPSTFPDGVTINGKAPDEVFAVYGGKWTHVVASITATTSDEATTYEIIEGADQTYTVGEDGATFRSNADYSLFENGGKVYVDDKEVTDFTSWSGSTYVKLGEAFMSTLSEGTHTLKLVFNDGGTAVTNFTVKEEAKENPKTGDPIAMWISVLAISVVGFVAVDIKKYI